jgi:hypothetical protein
MDSMQFAGHVDLAMGNLSHGVHGPFRGVVRSSACAQFPAGLSGRYTRVWLHNSYGIVVFEWDAERIGIMPIRHATPLRDENGEISYIHPEHVWSPVDNDGIRVKGHGDVPWKMPATPDDAVTMLRYYAAYAGHSMRDVKAR